MDTGYAVSDLMTQKPIMVSCDESLVDAALLMKQHKIGTLLIGKNSKIEGIMSEQDIVHNAVSNGKDPKGLSVKDVMVKNIHTISPDTEIFDAIKKMRDLDIRHLPVVHKGKLVGLLTLKDVLKFEPQLFELLTEKIELREEEVKRYRIEDN